VKKTKYTRIAIILVMSILFIAPLMAENTALTFTASNEDYVDCGLDLELQMGTHDLTVEFWFKTAFTETAQRIFGNGGTSASDDGYSIFINSAGKIRAEFSDGTTSEAKNNETIVTDGNWHHCAVVFDRDGELWVCVDGTCNTKLIDTLSDINYDNTNDTFVLGRTATSNSNNSFTGSLDELRIWSTALDTANVSLWRDQELTGLHPNISNLQAYYKFNESSGNTANDLTTVYIDNHASNGTITGAERVASDIPDFTSYADEELQFTDCAGTVNGSVVEDCAGVCDGSAVEDCAGVCDGTSVEDDCDVCDGGNADMDCAGVCDGGNVSDCVGTCGGTAVEDFCGNCGGTCVEGDISSCAEDASVLMDCAGACGGTAVIDCAAICGGETTQETCDACGSGVFDCAGVCDGTSVEDDCGVCDGGNADMDCAGVCDGGNVSDCAGTCGGTAVEDYCGNCGGTCVEGDISSCAEDAAVLMDCAGACEGPSVEDDCGVCDGGNADMDCAGICDGDTTQETCDACGSSIFDCFGNCEGTAIVDECGVCDGSGAIYECGCGGFPLGDGYGSCEFDVCLYLEGGTLNYTSTANIYGYQFDHDGCVEGIADAAASSVFGMLEATVTLVFAMDFGEGMITAGSGTLIELSGSITEDCLSNFVFSEYNGASITAGFGISDDDGGEVCDCDGNMFDECNICGGDNSSCADCAGTPNGTAQLDDCGECDTDSTNDNISCEQDCADVWGGTALVDCAGDCNGDAVEDCTGECNGSTIIDCAGECDGDAIIDCAGDCNGDAVEDCTGECNGTAIEDCAGDCNGDAVEDCTGDCNGTAELDCASVCDGTFVEDACDNCAGDCVDSDGAGFISCSSIDDNPNNLIIADECGECGGDGPNEGVDCNGDLLSIEALIPTEFDLRQNYPNPFNPVTEISFALPTANHIKLKVFDMVGQEVALIASGFYSAGLHTISFNGADLPSGIYFYTLNDGGETVIKKMILMK